MGVKKVEKTKIFLVFNTASIGDVLLCNALCQNIKNLFPNSKIVFIVDRICKDIAKYQKDVDEVFVFDKKGKHKGFIGMLKFILEFPYKKPDYAIVTYKNERNFIISKFLNARRIIMGKPLKKGDVPIKMQMRHILLLKQITTKPVQDLPIKYYPPACSLGKFKSFMNNSEKYIVLCTLTKNPPKDMPLDMAVDIIQKLNRDTDYKIVLTGIGKNSSEYADALEKAGCNFINLINKTSIIELSAVLKSAFALISADTGTMHLGYSFGVKTICVFFEQESKGNWAPDEKIYPNVKVLQNPTVEEIIKEVQ